MAVINTELKITSAAAPSGPLSMALNLQTTVAITCDDVHQGVITIADATSPGFLFKGETQDWRSGTFSGAGDAAAGAYGGYVYIKNTSTTSSNNDIYLGMAADDEVSAEELQDAADTDGGDSFATEFFRWCTIKKGEFMIFPWDYTSAITYDAAGAATLEWWIFDR
tara:strand:+ start:237 stop:734 length:498 start_codon:yes stop_codon:yes gene_type:complete